MLTIFNIRLLVVGRLAFRCSGNLQRRYHPEPKAFDRPQCNHCPAQPTSAVKCATYQRVEWNLISEGTNRANGTLRLSRICGEIR
jgi:hypothetical protein